MRWRNTIPLLMLMVVAMLCCFAGADLQKLTKQLGGSTGDSVQAAPDTSSVMVLKEGILSLYVIVAADSLSIYTTQISPNNTFWFTVDIDTVAIGAIEATADLGSIYGGMALRVIQDQITTGTWSSFGAAYVRTTD